MKSILDALQEGRLIELPDPDKENALEFLALLIEAIPDIGTGSDIVKEVMDREKSVSTALGKGVACPHARTHHEGELLCAIGWSPQGIDYGTPDGKKVHLVFMYYIPDSRRNIYLKEISSLARALMETGGIEAVEVLMDIGSVRDRLLDWVEMATTRTAPDAKARMIKLEARQLKEAGEEAAPAARKLTFIPFAAILLNRTQGHILTHNDALAEALEKETGFFDRLAPEAEIEAGGYQIAVLETESYPKDKALYHCVAVKL